MASGLPDRWWPLAIQQWATCYNASVTGRDGFTPWQRRFGEKAPFTVYPFGALVLFKLAGAAIKAVDFTDSAAPRSKKWSSRLIPALLVGATLTPGCMWAQSYEIVPLASMLSESRATRVSVRRVHDVVFPEVVSFPLRQRLNYFGAFEDVTLPSPHTSDESELFSVVAGEGRIDDVLEYDGLVRENRASFKRTRVTEVACMIEPDEDDQPGAIVAEPDDAAQSDSNDDRRM